MANVGRATEGPKSEIEEFWDPPREFSVAPFWFWNDDLDAEEIVRQIAGFEAHGVYGFVIHPRVGLPESIGWMSERMLGFVRLAVEEARRRGMFALLYDEGMYPSGSSSGQVVAANPEFAARCLDKIDLDPGEQPKLMPGCNLIAVVDRPRGRRLAVIDRPSGGVIRGLHYIGDGPKEDTPAAADILNPAAVESFISLVYERYAAEFQSYFGSTIPGIFTDEPSPQGRGGAGVPGTTGIVDEVSRILRYDFGPHLADLWYDDRADSAARRVDYHRAIAIRLEETYYGQLSAWCADHGVALAGHPAGSMDIGAQRFFQIPGQDLVWRMVLPGATALTGPNSTVAKCASSAMVHVGRRRNGNELYGAYGNGLSYDEMRWLANWCFVRGQNLLYPHAFYYSMRGPRGAERPPDVGPNAAWWNRYRPYADACRRLSWLNTDSRQVCKLAILGDADWLPDEPARVCFEGQRDFNYIEVRHLGVEAEVTTSGINILGMQYDALVIDGRWPRLESIWEAVAPLTLSGRLLVWRPAASSSLPDGARAAYTPEELLCAVEELTPPDVTLHPASTDIRYRHVIKAGRHFYMVFNEGGEAVTAQVEIRTSGPRRWLDPDTGAESSETAYGQSTFQAGTMRVLRVGEEGVEPS